MVTREKKLNAFAHNIANVNTAGFKKDTLTISTFGEHIAVRLNRYNPTPPVPIGRGVFMVTTDSEHVDFEQGALEATHRAFDLAIVGQGFFVVNDAEGNQHLTRDGQFALDDAGFLILPGIGRVQGSSGDINLNGRSDFIIDARGNIFLPPLEPGDDYDELGQLSIAIPADYDAMLKNASGTFFTEEFSILADFGHTQILQQHIERSNVNMTQEMTRVMNSQRALQSASQLVRMFDSMKERSNDSIGRLR